MGLAVHTRFGFLVYSSTRYTANGCFTCQAINYWGAPIKLAGGTQGIVSGQDIIAETRSDAHARNFKTLPESG